MNVVEPHPDPETVSALLDTAWRLAGFEGRRTDALDQKMATLATFSSILVSITTLGATLVWSRGLSRPVLALALPGIVAGIGLLTASVVVAAVALLPTEQLTLDADYVRSLPTWHQVRKEPTQVRGETLRTLVTAVAAERVTNERKTARVHVALWLLVAGLMITASEGLTLMVWRTIR